MPTDLTQAQYEQLESIAARFAQESDRIRQLQLSAQSQIDRLAHGGWLADAGQQFQREMANDIVPAITRLVIALSHTAAVMRQIRIMLQQAEEQAAGMLSGDGTSVTAVPGYGMIPNVNPGADPSNPFGIAFSGGFMTSWYNDAPKANNGIAYKDFPYNPLTGQYNRYYAGMQYGNMSQEDIDKFRARDPFALTPDKYINPNVNFYRDSVAGGVAVGQMQLGGDNWNLNARALSAEGSAGYSFGYGKDGLQAKANFDAGAYLARVTGNAEIAGIRATGDAYIGANVTGEGSLTLNPMSGDVRARVGGEAFVGGRAGGEVKTGAGPVTVGAQGSVSYGLGASGRADIGYQDGVFRAEVLAGVTAGLGVEGGFTVELDVQGATETVVDYGRQGAEWVGSLFD